MTEEGSRFLDKEALQRYKEYLIKEERAKATVDKYLHDVRVFEAFVRREQSCEADWNSAADTSRKAVTKEKVIEFKRNLLTIYHVRRSRFKGRCSARNSGSLIKRNITAWCGLHRTWGRGSFR